jgi:hypothetical protein
MTIHPTSRRHLLKGAAMLTAIPVAAGGGVPVFDVAEEPLSRSTPPHPFAVRIATLGDWLDLPPPALTYDPEDLAGGPLVTDELVDWMRACGRKAMAWVLGDGPHGYTRERAQADCAKCRQEQRFAEVIRHLDDTETRLLLDAMQRGQSGEVPFEVALEEARQAIEAHRARLAA